MSVADETVQLLVTRYDYDLNEAAVMVEESQKNDPQYWDVNAEAEPLAEMLADNEDD